MPASVDSADLGPILGAWQTEPVAIPPGLVSRIDEACRASLGDSFPGGLAITVIDARGEGVLTPYFAGPDGSSAFCYPMVVDALGFVSPGRGHASSGGEPPDPLAPLEIEFVEFRWDGEAPITATYLSGRAGEGVERVEIQRVGQPPIVASMANGWWAAWAPGPMGDAASWRIVAFDAAGREVDIIDGVPQVGG